MSPPRHTFDANGPSRPRICSYLFLGDRLHFGRQQERRPTRATRGSRSRLRCTAGKLHRAGARSKLFCIFFFFAKSSGPASPTYEKPKAGELVSGGGQAKILYMRKRRRIVPF